jgi:hypothetical protein
LVGFAPLMAAYVVARQTGTTHAQDLLDFTLGGLKEKQDLMSASPHGRRCRCASPSA